MSVPAASRKTILQSIYCIRRRRTALPLSEVTNLRLNNNSDNKKDLDSSLSPKPAMATKPKSLIQGQKVVHHNRGHKHSHVSGHGHGHGHHHPTTSSSPSMAMGNANVCRPSSGTQMMRRNNAALLRGIGIREHYAATSPANSSVSLHQFGAVDGNGNGNDVIPSLLPDTDVGTDTDTDTDTDTSMKSDLIVVLDLDECLIHSQFMKENEYRQLEDRPQSHAFDNDSYEPSSLFASACESFRFALPDCGELVHVNKRPNLDTFLQQVTERYETHIFTAAQEIYASPLLDVLDPNGTMFTQRYYRESCIYLPSHGVYVKDLSRVFNDSYNQKRAVLVDNNPMSFLSNPKNGILVSNFYDDPKDDTLQAVLELLHELDGEEDVRPLLNDKFALKSALKEVMDVQGSHSW